MFAFEIGVGIPIVHPYGFTRRFVQLDDLAGPRIVIHLHPAVYQLQIKRVTVEYGSGGHSKLDIDRAKPFSDIELPNLFTIHVQTSEYTGAEKDPNMLAICTRSRGRRIPFTGPCILVSRPDLCLPNNLPIRSRYT